ncbi:hypothetical protein ABZS66_42255 [Dactylosporangium sp. NPDC005572]|uniref:hypothetical protein n=1 Tax=Dactylosporangium sp. NPDC005572 TaxID=3156889 RepID=UPI0033B629CA
MRMRWLLVIGVWSSFSVPLMIAGIGGALGADSGGAAGGGIIASCVPGGPGGTVENVELDAEQLANAQTIVSTTQGIHPADRRAAVIAVATAMQESSLHNSLEQLDHDSIGLFQQRVSIYGSDVAADPVKSTTAFVQRLLQVPGWATIPLTEAAQAVQRSAHPDAYARWETLGAGLVERYWTASAPDEVAGDSSTPPADAQQCLTVCPASTATAAPDPDACVAAGTVFSRAQSWLTAWSGGPVPYLSSVDPATYFQGYRRDCSGYVSMALGLEGPGLNTSGLAARSTLITKQDLQPGDMLINTAPGARGHVVLFERWTDTTMTRYYGYEQTGSGGTHHRVIPYPYFGTYAMSPYRLGGAG